MTKNDKKDESMYIEYFNYTSKLISDYGEKSVVLLQCGSFFEIYGLKDFETGEISGSKIVETARLLEFNVSHKKNVVKFNDKNKQLLMAGGPDYTKDKMVNKLVEDGFTVGVYIQVSEGNSIKRVLDKVYSPGTVFSSEIENINSLTNNTMCIWIQKHKPFKKNHIRDVLMLGASVLNVYTGQVFVFENDDLEYEIITSTFDELERFVTTYNPNEIILIYDEEDTVLKKDLHKIVQYSGIITENIHFVSSNNKKVIHCSKEIYVKEIISSVYDNEYYDSCESFYHYRLATSSMCYLINFVREHNFNLTKNIKYPEFINLTCSVVLANHTLSQLNIIPNGQIKKAQKKSSVLSLLNQCKTSMGKRLLESRITNPSNNEEWLEKEYNIIENLMKNNDININNIRSSLNNVIDIEKLLRYLTLEVVSPSQLSKLYQSILIFKNEMKQMKTEDMFLYLNVENLENFKEIFFEKSNKLLNMIENVFIMEKCATFYSINSINEHLLKPGIEPEVDSCILEYGTNRRTLEIIAHSLDAISKKNETGINLNISWVKIYETDKSGLSLRITKTRSKKLIESIKSNKITELSKESSFIYEEFGRTGYNDDILWNIELSNLELVSATNNEMEIREQNINKLCKNIEILNQKRIHLVIDSYKKHAKQIEEHFNTIENIGKYIAKYDVIINNIYIANRYNYIKPIIEKESEKSFFDAKDMRHCLIEQLQEDFLYVPNDVSLGKNGQDGISLFGINAVGKTSLIRSIGVTVIMAQSGMYVPCSSFVYKPYNSIFSRILGNDNLFRGLSTFAVEMSELRTILRSSDENSLILGDELCSGTESESAFSIVVAGLQHLSKNRSSFIFATHFHEIVEYDEIKEMKNLSLKHLAVTYDKENDCLVYDRKLKDGPGMTTYGLEVCKSLHMNTEFIENAFELRNKYFENTVSTLSNKTTKYNASKIKGICEICKKNKGVEIHHLQEQKNANKLGFINSFHKNHKANLISICEECHDKIHSGEINGPTVKKKTTKGIKLVQQDVNI
tara:strand:+ start:16 stop:3087 length:3072 start_codon:yes stop_codon:yes gene_type:complete